MPKEQARKVLDLYKGFVAQMEALNVFYDSLKSHINEARPPDRLASHSSLVTPPDLRPLSFSGAAAEDSSAERVPQPGGVPERPGPQRSPRHSHRCLFALFCRPTPQSHL